MRRLVKPSTRLRLASLLPQAVLARLLWAWARRRPRTALDTARDVETLVPQPEVRIVTYWSDVPGAGRGPSASVHVLDFEVLRLDCFGDDRGHMHLNPDLFRLWTGRSRLRLFFPAGDRRSHVARAAFELATNLEAAKHMNPIGAIRRVALDRAKLATAAAEMERRMIALLEAHEPEASTRAGS